MAGHVSKYFEVRRVLTVTLVLNLAVAIAKLVIGYSTRTLSMVADGYHSALDASSNVIGFIAIYFAYKPADDDHQYGHRKYETLSAMAISISLFLVAYRILLEAYHRIGNAVYPEVGVISFVVMFATLLVNLGVSTYERREGQRLKSQLLVSDAAHTRSDVFATSAVIASLVASKLGYPGFDIVASMFIAAIIVRIGYNIITQNLSVIADAVAIDPETVRAIVMAVNGVTGCERIRTRGTEDHVFMDLVCFVAGTMTMSEAHRLADRIEQIITTELPMVKDIVVHLEPSEKLERTREKPEA